eukprot:5134502-Pyramimonas_sp.AAC.1
MCTRGDVFCHWNARPRAQANPAGSGKRRATNDGARLGLQTVASVPRPSFPPANLLARREAKLL